MKGPVVMNESIRRCTAEYDAVFWRGVAIFFMCFAIVFVTMSFMDGNNLITLKREAVERGYAEWYSAKPGGQPDSWRWKE